MLIASANQKGGVGKSTIIRNLALMRASAGHKVVLIDADDKQNTLDKWYTRREDFNMIKNPDYDGNLILLTEESDLLTAAITTAVDTGCDTVMVDLPGRAVTPMAEMLYKANYCLCPVSASSDDYDVLPYMGELVEKTRKYKSDLNLLVIHNKSHSHAKRRQLEKQDLEYQCNKSKGLKLLPMDFRAAVAFQDAAKYGLALFEYAKIRDSGVNDHNILAFNSLYKSLWNEDWKPLDSTEQYIVENIASHAELMEV